MHRRLLLIFTALVCAAVPTRSAEPTNEDCRRHNEPLPVDVVPARRAPAAGPLVIGSSAATEDELVGEVSEPRYSQFLKELSGYESFQLDGQTRQIETRWAYGPDHPNGINLARDYISDRFETMGYQVTLQDFVFTYALNEITATNVIAVRPGSTNADEVLVVGAHYDARAALGIEDAHGAEDNASGVAAVMHLAEILRNYQSNRTIHFVAFACEEYSLRGSSYYAQQAVDGGVNIVAALTMDMISAWVDDYGVLVEGEPEYLDLVVAVEDNVQQWTTLQLERSLDSFGSDHVPFQIRGIPAILAIELDWDQYVDYHKTTDTFDKLDTTLGTEITKAIAGSIADIAGVFRKVAIEDPLPGNTPARHELALVGNLPNPFNPRTTISFTIPTAGMTRLEIFDTRGRRVRALSTGFLEAGPHQRAWDGMDESGRPVSSGVYLSRLVHPDGVRSHSLTLVR